MGARLRLCGLDIEKAKDGRSLADLAVLDLRYIIKALGSQPMGYPGCYHSVSEWT